MVGIFYSLPPWKVTGIFSLWFRLGGPGFSSQYHRVPGTLLEVTPKHWVENSSWVPPGVPKSNLTNVLGGPKTLCTEFSNRLAIGVVPKIPEKTNECVLCSPLLLFFSSSLLYSPLFSPPLFSFLPLSFLSSTLQLSILLLSSPSPFFLASLLSSFSLFLQNRLRTGVRKSRELLSAVCTATCAKSRRWRCEKILRNELLGFSRILPDFKNHRTMSRVCPENQKRPLNMSISIWERMQSGLTLASSGLTSH